MTRKLGKRAPLKAPSIKFKDIRTGIVPAVPLAADHFAQVPNFGLYLNDRYGVCGPVSVANQVKLITRYLTDQQIDVTQDDVFDLYRRSGNPDFDPNTGAGDRGVYMQEMLGALLKGGMAGYKPIAFAEVDVNNREELRAAVAIFGSTLDGMYLRKAQDAQTDTGKWDYDPTSDFWGGHAVVSGLYDTDSIDCITWALQVERTDAFIEHQLEEAWVVVWPWNLGTRQFQEGIDLAALKSAYESLTGRTFNAEPEPPPTPIPGPDVPPAPEPEPDPTPAPPAPPPEPEKKCAFAGLWRKLGWMK